ncbi:hypothetical protein PVL29_022868 [Vitis rotundifolia]|uniref:Uncharacterized protein n=1 Tax=Vitis rotundifolia TaxID=103349 RepID=A0AA38YWQ6_VITRO|nr:hypothetical protein PVL29_022868 [Vitis rotundifolia]
MTMIDSKRCLHYLSLKLALKFAAMSFFPSSLQMIWGTTGSTPVSCSVSAEDESAKESDSVLAAEEDAEEAEVGEDASGKVDAFLVS